MEDAIEAGPDTGAEQWYKFHFDKQMKNTRKWGCGVLGYMRIDPDGHVSFVYLRQQDWSLTTWRQTNIIGEANRVFDDKMNIKMIKFRFIGGGGEYTCNSSDVPLRTEVACLPFLFKRSDRVGFSPV